MSGNLEAASGVPGDSDPGGEPFPRGTTLPKQSPIFWVEEKDRYLRQLLISDLEKETGRRLIVYFGDGSAASQIDPSDDQYLLEVCSDIGGQPTDLVLETIGGYTDSTEKFVSVIRSMCQDLRVIVPRRAKSNGTVIALAGAEIAMGPSSELGPIDPNVTLGPDKVIPARFILQAKEKFDPITLQVAVYALMQTQKLARDLLASGMLREVTPDVVDGIVESLSSRDAYHSHGSVIDAREAQKLGLKISYFAAEHSLWRKWWLLRCMYDADSRRSGMVKIFESRKLSQSVQTALPA